MLSYRHTSLPSRDDSLQSRRGRLFATGVLGFYAALVFALGEPITAGLSVGLAAVMLRLPGMLDPQRLSRALRARGTRMRLCLQTEAGFTLVDLLVVISLLAMVLTAVLSVLDTTTTVVAQDRERALAIPELEKGLHRMTGDLRQAYEVVGPLSPTTASNYMDVRVRKTTPGSSTTLNKRVLYRCDTSSPSDAAYRACYRYETDATRSDPAGTVPTGSGELVIDRLTNGTTTDPVFGGFSYPAGASRATYGTATAKAPSKGGRKIGQRSTIVLNDAFYMRNLDLVR